MHLPHRLKDLVAARLKPASSFDINLDPHQALVKFTICELLIACCFGLSRQSKDHLHGILFYSKSHQTV
jgi:hypothetical protein